MEKDVYSAINAKRNRPWVNEEEVRVAWISAIESNLGIHFDAERAKRDASYNNVIIEFKAPGLFNGSKNSPKFLEATQDRLLKYIIREADRENRPQDEYIGIAIDGDHICFAQVIDGKISTQHLLPFSEASVKLVIEAVSNNYRRAVTADNLIQDFGQSAPEAIELMQVFADALAQSTTDSENNKIKMLFEEWKTLYGQVADLSTEQEKSIETTLKFKWTGPPHQKMSGRLFVIHTYNSLIIKLLAAEIVSAHGLSSQVSPTQRIAFLLQENQLIESLENDIEKGRIYTEAGINGFIEEAIFSWYLDACKLNLQKSRIIIALRAILGKLALYRTDRLERTRDVLRDFYQGLVPETLRKSLGEFYTPDWLVDHTLSSSNIESWLNVRSLDPTCGSGSFVIEMIRRKRQAAAAVGLDASATVTLICENVWGFDLNPLAVQTARVNYLMEIADLLKECAGKDVEIPILLADAIYSPASDPDSEDDIVSYQIGSQVAKLNIRLPGTLAWNRPLLDRVFEVMGEAVEEDLEFKGAARKLISSNLVNPEQLTNWTAPLKETYDQVLNLHRKNWNGIWFRIVRNFFWSATAGQFDLVCGNPPWVRWSKLPEAYRERVKPTCEQYEIFSKTKFHGGNELDISAIITYTAGDKWLKHGGKLAFVITQSVFQAPSSAGFRKFKINANNWLRPQFVEDLQRVKPFPDATNKTSVVLFEKSKTPPTYPIPYKVWDAKNKGEKSIKPNSDLLSVLSTVKVLEKEAVPVGEEGSPWAILSPGRWSTVSSLSGTSDWVAGRKGITADLNGVYFVPIEEILTNGLVKIKTRPEAGKRDIGPARSVRVEADMLFPLIKGASDFEACYLKPTHNLFTFVPNNGITQKAYTDSLQRINNLPKTKAFFSSFRGILESRSTYKGRMPGAPYYAIYNVGDFTFKPWKVVWAEMSGSFSAAVAGSGEVPHIGSRPYVPDHKVYFVAFDEAAPAYFLCGILNSQIVREYVESHNISIQVGNIFKHMSLPKYDQNDNSHSNLVELVQQAHNEHNKEKRSTILQSITGIADSLIEKWISEA